MFYGINLIGERDRERVENEFGKKRMNTISCGKFD